MNSIINIIKSLTPNKYIPKPDKTELERLANELDKIKYHKLIECLKEVISSSKCTKKLKDTLDNLTKDLKEEGLTTNDACDLIEEAIKEIQDENLEDTLDKECERYNKFTESNPAEHVSYDKTNNKFVFNNTIIKFSKKNKSELIKKVKEKLGEEKRKIFSKFYSHKKIEYKGKKIIIYLTKDNEAYFDINHIINLLDEVKVKNKKYDEYKNEIVLYDIRDNEFGGFYIKEFVNQETFYKILLHSNSSFARKFKDEIAKILDTLTQQGKIIIQNDKLVIKEQIKKPIDYLDLEYVFTQTYDNIQLVNFAKERIKEFKKVNWNKYLNRHIMYFFIITLEDPLGLNRILCKPGYSSDLIDRLKKLPSEYKCKFYLIGLKLVHSVQDEKQFHALLKKKFPEFVVDLKIGAHDKEETYVFDKELYKTFLSFADIGEFNDKEVKLEKEAEELITDYFENMERNFEIELMNKMKQLNQIEKIVNIYQQNMLIATNNRHYDFLELKEKHRHIEVMKDKEIIIKDKDIELKKLELQIIQSTK